MKKIIFSLLIISPMLFSCKKDKKDCSLNSSNIVGSYKLTAITYKATPSSTAVDEFAAEPACEKDNIITINSNGTTSTSDVGTVCSPASNDAGTWSLSGNQLITDGDASTVTSFDCSGLTATQTGILVAGDVTTITLAKQ